MKTLENIFWTVVVLVVLGNILFLVETFYPLGDFMKANFGEFGVNLGRFIGTLTATVDIIALSIFLNVKLKNRF